MIRVDKVSKSYKDLLIFKEINIEIPDGVVAYIKGPNGSGKSVFLKMITGYARPTKGEITVDGKIIGKDIDFIPDSGLFINAPEFVGNWTGMENLRYLADIKKVASEKEIINLSEKLNLQLEDLNKKYKTYSQGMKQKLRIVQAIMDKPKYLILDEPFDTLDDSSRVLAVELFDEYRKNHPETTIIYTSHDQSVSLKPDLCFRLNENDLSLWS